MLLASRNFFLSAKPAISTKARWILCLVAWLGNSYVSANPSTAFFYDKPMPIELLSHFKQVVVEPDNIDDIEQLISKGVDVFAYLSVGEINTSRPWYAEIPETWLVGKNTAWGSHIVDLSQKAWQEYVIDKLMTPLWERGYRGFFLDTLDSYLLITKDTKYRLVQQQALIDLIREMHRRFPDAKLILNRGFELLPNVAGDVIAVAAESLFQGWNASSNSYGEVKESDRGWLLNKLNQVHDQYGLQIIVIDYISPKQRDLAREVADKISELGFTPWVSNPAMDMMGIGSLEVFPKRILALYDGEDRNSGIQNSKFYKLLTKLLGYLGYTFDYVDARKGLPNYCLAGKFTGIVTQLNSKALLQSEMYKSWLTRQNDDGMKVMTLGKY
jgi:polysaccharide biosynthesis protein PelA